MNDACLYWGLDLMKLIFELNEFSLKIRTAAKDLYYNDTPQDPAVLENILFSNDPNDEINKRINEIVEEIKINLEPIYKDKQFKWKNNAEVTSQNSAMYVTALNFAFSNIKRAYHSQFSKVNRRQSPHFRRITKKDAVI